MTALRQYETTYILNPELDESERTKVRERFTTIIEGQFGGSILKIDEWGRRPLAYKIKKENFGYYVHARYHASGDAIAEMERILRISDPVIKFLTVRLEDDEEFDESDTSLRDVAGPDPVAEGDSDDEDVVRKPAPKKAAPKKAVVEDDDDDDDDDDSDSDD